MGKASKASKINELFFNEPSKHWHFKEIVQEVKISENRANYWLKQLVEEKIISYNKPEGKMPYYTAYFEHSNYKNKKKIYALEQFYKVGFLRHLASLDAQAIIIFGSFSRSDWHSKSDIDLCIIGNDAHLEKEKFEQIFNREIQVFTFKNTTETKKTNPHLIQNIINGYFVKGEIQNIIGEIHA
jgi:predicted nucleotidyltransferase